MLNNEEEIGTDFVPDSPYENDPECGYYEPHVLADQSTKTNINRTSYFHINCRRFSNNWERFKNLICELHSDTFSFEYIGLSEAYQCSLD